MNTIISPTGTTVQPQGVQRRKGVGYWIRRVLLGLFIARIALAAMGAIYQAVATAIDQRTYIPPGQQAVEVEQLHFALQNDLAALSTNSTHRIVEGSDHQSLQFNSTQASVTSAAIRAVVEAVRTGQPLAQ